MYLLVFLCLAFTTRSMETLRMKESYIRLLTQFDNYLLMDFDTLEQRFNKKEIHEKLVDLARLEGQALRQQNWDIMYSCAFDYLKEEYRNLLDEVNMLIRFKELPDLLKKQYENLLKAEQSLAEDISKSDKEIKNNTEKIFARTFYRKLTLLTKQYEEIRESFPDVYKPLMVHAYKDLNKKFSI